MPTDFCIRKAELQSVLPIIAHTQPQCQATFVDHPKSPTELAFDQVLEAKIKAIYTRNYEIFGVWRLRGLSTVSFS